MEEKFEEKKEEIVSANETDLKRKKHKKRGKIFNKKIAKSTVILGTVFCISFLATANFYMKSKNLVFADELQKVDELVKTVNEQKKNISTLENDVDKYKKLYEEYKEAYEEEKKNAKKTASKSTTKTNSSTTKKSSSAAPKNTAPKTTEKNNTADKKEETESKVETDNEKKESLSTETPVDNAPAVSNDNVPVQNPGVVVDEPAADPDTNSNTPVSGNSNTGIPVVQPSQPASSAAPQINVGGTNAQ